MQLLPAGNPYMMCLRKLSVLTVLQFTVLTVIVLLTPVRHAFAGALLEADHAYELRNYSKALSIYTDLASKGNPQAEFRMATIYRDGFAVNRDMTESVRWLQKAAAHGNIRAQGVIGGIYADGKWLPRDLKEALVWIERAAKAGDSLAQVDLGWAYMSNFLELPPNYWLAMKWSLKAASQGEGEAASNIGVLYENGWGVPVNYSEAIKWYQKALEYGVTSAQTTFHLANLYEKGKGVAVDIETAKKYFQDAIDSGDKEFLDQATLRLQIIQDTQRLNELDDVKYPEIMPRRNKIPRYRHFDTNG